jgi:porphobilinogen synthase
VPYPITRPRRLRENPAIRDLVRETAINLDDLIYPLFIIEGEGLKIPVSSMPGVYQLSVDCLAQELAEVAGLGIKAVLLFGIPDQKDEIGSPSWQPGGVVQRAIGLIKAEFPDLVVVTDVCLCEYTSHGHCGVVEGGRILNDPSLEPLGKMALSHAVSGADIVAPSDMMDGRVGHIRKVLDDNGFSHLPIMAYSAKYASGFYGPFREAAQSAPQFGDRRSYQMDPANVREAMRELKLDLREGADILMVKPALAYLDVIAAARQSFKVPIAAYNVSGEYVMIKAAAERGWLDEQRIAMEVLNSIKRAGADLIITYFAKDAARWIK